MAPKTPRTGTRTSSRLASKSSSPASLQKTPSSVKSPEAKTTDSAKKRKADSSISPSERAEKRAKPEQKTLEEVVGDADPAREPQQPKQQSNDLDKEPSNGSKSDGKQEGLDTKEVPASADEPKEQEDAKLNEQTAKASTDGAIEESSKREAAMPSNVLEKGVFYFFSRPRVGIDEPKSAQDIARSFFVLRPLPDGAKLGRGALEDLKNNRLIALPKKVLPKSHSDRFMAFVEKQGVSIETLKSEFLSSSTYETKTLGERTSPPVTPLGEGIYAITTTGRENHLAYMLTIPSEPGEVQKTLGLADKGSFIISTKNPEVKGPATAQFENPAEFSKAIMDDFRGRSWMPTEPQHLNYDACQILLIGEAQGELGKAVEAKDKDANSEEKHVPEEEMELLEHEDLKRVEALKGDDSIFDDLGISKKDYPQLPTTW